LFSIPMTVLMFVCLPRTGYPLFDFLNARGSSAGFTDHVTLGDISGIQENSSVILRVESAQVDPQMLYWRGIVMDSFDGKSWRGAGRPRRREGVFQLEGRRLVQTIYLEPYGNRYLFALDKPVSLQYRDASVSEDFTITAKRDIDQRIRYSVVSVLSGYDRLESIERNKYLQLPTAGLERIRPLVGRLTTGTGTEADALSILHYLTDGTFKYSLKNLPVTSEPIEDFLLIHKSGNCEYFASSMAVMLRMAGIPARLVGGYHGGVYNAIGGYYLVTQNNAHVWVEVYLDNKGWVRMDPTPASGAAVPKGRQSLAFKLRLLLDAANYYWNSMVIGYDLNRQVSLLSDFKNAVTAPRVDITAVKRPAVLLTLIAISFTAIAIGIARFIKRRKPEVLVMERFARIMKKYGYVRSAAEGLREFAARIDNIPLRNKVIVFISEIEKIYYRDRVMTEADQVSLMRFLEDI
ncbi:MAG TPA: DUF3488 and transglutaminase-like domain-containing protein, partial [Dissulfurispiraceae bacterium]|nr:DUF3488 and transglutaminase-like domain-containing protein [Dissulfurispiraceae bacterium]